MKKALLFIALLGGVFFACQKNSLIGDEAISTNGIVDERGGGGRCLRGDTVLVADLPAAIATYVADNYAGATIDLAVVKHNGNYAVSLSSGEVLIFNADGEFVRLCDGNGPGNPPGDSTGPHHGPHHGPWMPGDTTHVPGNSTGHGPHHGPWTPGDSTHVPIDTTGNGPHHGPGGGHGGGHGHHGHGG